MTSVAMCTDLNGSQQYEVDQFAKWLVAKSISHCRVDVNNRASNRGAPQILVLEKPPIQTNAPGVAVLIKGNRDARMRSSQIEWLERLDASGWLTILAFVADEAIAEFLRFGYRVQ